MVKAYFGDPGEDLAEAFHRMMEKDTGKKIFTLRVLKDHGNAESGVDLAVAFEDRSMLIANVCFPEEDVLPGMVGLRVKAQYL